MAQSQPNQPTNTAILLILEQITALQRSMLTTLTTILSNQVKEMATEASIQAAADAIAAAIREHAAQAAIAAEWALHAI